jgi:hypothetical protein
LVLPLRICRRWAPLLLCLTELELAELAPVLVLGVSSPVHLGEDLPRQPLAGRAGTALPCHPDEHLGVWWASSCLYTLCSSYRPWSLTILVKTSEPSS